MRDYQPKTTPYVMERTVYARVLAVVRDYPRMLNAQKTELASVPTLGHGVGKDPTADKAQRIERLDADIRAVHNALARIPREYHAGILDNIIFRVPLIRIDGASERTWTRWKSRFLWEVAAQMDLVDKNRPAREKEKK